MTKTMLKEEFLNWLKDVRDICDHAHVWILEEIIFKVEDGLFDNNRTVKKRIPDTCKFQKQSLMITPNENKPGVFEMIPFYYCLMEDEEWSCPYPAKMCPCKLQEESLLHHMHNNPILEGNKSKISEE
jgi:hypothetical protein